MITGGKWWRLKPPPRKSGACGFAITRRAFTPG
jgi:hypothetical protein